MGGLWRTSELNCTPNQFTARLNNCDMHINLLVNHVPNVVFSRTRGFSHMANGHMMPVAYFSSTSFVPGPECTKVGRCGQTRYFDENNLRRKHLGGLPANSLIGF